MTLRRVFLTTVTTLALVTAAPVATLAADATPTPEAPGGVESPHSPGGVPAGPVGPSFYTFPAASIYSKSNLGARPKGVNDFSCKPAAGTYPVILVPGTGEDAFATWSYYAPRLKAEGLCVYTFNYNPLTNPLDEAKPFSGHIRSTAAFMAAFVDRVLAESGAQKVDLVGHSQGGGPLPRAYLKYYGGDQKVHRLVGLVPSNHGTTVYGLDRLLSTEGTLSNWMLTTNAARHNNYALPEQLVGSPFLQDLNDGGLTRPGVLYTVLTTRYDNVVIPYTNAVIAEPGVDNIVMQDVCAKDHTDHFGFTYDPVAYTVVRNVLLPQNPKPVTCVYVPGVLQ